MYRQACFHNSEHFDYLAAKDGDIIYLALYRKYRPRTFDDVISQEHITTTLKNQIISQTAGHAYLFTGSRGTGKTTCAKIFAMAVNCEDPKDGSPCLECERCKEILDGSATDIVEMDAASNNGVDDVRQLRDEVNYTPVSCKYRVYIIDEVHMLSAAAFNALLKTLEEPPPHVKFILATTELHKVPATIVSRCQRFEFRRIDPADSAKRLHFAAENEGISLDDDAAELISRLSDGGMRDALSILDRCATSDRHVTSALVRNCAGVADNAHLSAFAKMTAAGDVSGCIRLLSELHAQSKDMALIVDELIGRFRDIMICKTAPDAPDLISAMPSELDEIKAVSDELTLSDILRCLELLRQCADGITKTRQRKTFVEMCLIKMCMGLSAEAAPRSVSMKPEMRLKQIPVEEFVPTPPEKLSRESLINISKMRALGEETAKICESEEAAPAPPQAIEETPPAEEAEEAPPAEEAEEIAPNEPPEEEKTPVPESISGEEWQAAIARCDNMTSSMLDGSKAEISGRTLTIYSSNNLLVDNIKGEKLAGFEAEISKALGFSANVRIVEQKNENAENGEQSEIARLLAKAKQFGVEIKEE